jgi:uncharacterized membrane protein
MNELGRQKMSIRKVAALGVMLLASRLLFADASYQETTQVTGGSIDEQHVRTHDNNDYGARQPEGGGE